MLALLSANTGREYDKAEFEKAGERIFNLEKSKGFRREDDWLPDRFFEDARRGYRTVVGCWLGGV